MRTFLSQEKFSIFAKLMIIVAVVDVSIDVSAQRIIGTQGMMNIPTADMYAPKTFVGGVDYIETGLMNYDFPVYNYYIDFTPYSFVELTFRCTLLKLKYELPSDSYCEQDRSFSVRLRPLQEKEDTWYPGVVVGSNDFFSYMGHSYFSAIYGVATKHIPLSNVGLLGLTAGYSKKIDDGVVYDGPFGGIEFTPVFYKSFRTMLEYDTKGVNFGAELNVLKHLNILVYTREFNKVCGGLSYQYTIKY